MCLFCFLLKIIYMKNFLLFILALLIVGNVFGNNIVVDNVVLQKGPTQGSAFVKFDISWENSWREDVQAGNWDAAWVFIKFKSKNGQWQHAKLSPVSTDQVSPESAVINASDDGMGVFIYRKHNGVGDVAFSDVKLMWDYSLTGLLPNDTLEVKVLGIEMVFVPQGNFWLGDGSSYGSFRQTETNSPVLVTHSSAQLKMDGSDILAGDAILQNGLLAAGDSGICTTGLGSYDNVTFPTGFNGFYCMKYEISQKQYADFLSLLNPLQALSRYSANNGSYRNSITGINPNFIASYPDLACNFLNWADGTAYADWAGLRPMTELEFEKASRGNQSPVNGEFAWGNASLHNSAYTIINAGTEMEAISNPGSFTGNAWYWGSGGQVLEGPVRCGIFASSAINKTRIETGSSFYGIMELSGNLWEQVVMISTPDGRNFDGSHGNGLLDENGNANEPNWTGTEALGAGFRGGSWAESAGLYPVSHRGLGTYSNSIRDASSGFRCVRSFTGVLSVTTDFVHEITANSAKLGGRATNQGNSEITERGVCWNTTQYPLITNSNVLAMGSGLGYFSETISGLLENTSYYLRAYVINGEDTVYGNQMVFATSIAATLSIVTTADVTNIALTTATSGGNISSDGGSAILQRGVCWSTATNPTIDDNKTLDGTGTGSFVSSITGLTASTLYYLRAYATNSVGTAYGAEIGFTTALANTSPYADNSTVSIAEDNDKIFAVADFNYGDADGDPMLNLQLISVPGMGMLYLDTLSNGIVDAGEELTAGMFVSKSDIDGLNFKFHPLPNENGIAYTSFDFKVSDGIGFSAATYTLTIDVSPVNDAPVAIADSYSVAENATLSIDSGSGVLANDTDVEGDALTTFKISDPQHGTLSLNLDGSFTYVHDGSETTLDWFDYKANDGTVNGNTVTVTITINPENDAPVALADAYSVNEGATLNVIAALGLLANDTDADGNALTAIKVSDPANGTLTLNPDGSFTYIHDGSETTTDSFTYKVNDGTIDGNGVLVTITINPANDAPVAADKTFTTPFFADIVFVYTDFSYSDVEGDAMTALQIASMPSAGTLYVDANTDNIADAGEEIVLNSIVARGDLDAGNLKFKAAANAFGNPYTSFGFKVYDGIGYSAEFTFTINVTAYPVVSTEAISLLAETTVTSGGNVTSDGGLSITARGVCWSTGVDPTIANLKTIDGSGTGAFVSAITGLTSKTLYHVRAYATNNNGTSYGEDISFTTKGLPELTTLSATSIAMTTATTGGNITNDGGYSIIARGVCYGLSENPDMDNDAFTSDGDGLGIFTSNLTGLTPNTLYHIRAYAVSDLGTSYGNDLTFNTLDLPTLTTTAISAISFTSVSSGGNITSDGGSAITERGVCWSVATSPTIADSKTSDGTGTGSFTSNITGLASGFTYYTRAYATSAAGTAYGNQESYITYASPGVLTTDVASFSDSSATVNCMVSYTGYPGLTQRGVCWSTISGPTVLDNKTMDGDEVGVYVSTILGLLPSTEYFVRAYAINPADTVYGDEFSFTTAATSLGKFYQGGYVFYMDGTGQNGLISSDQDQSTFVDWGCLGILTGATGDTVGTGLTNSINILNSCTGSSAAEICDALNLNAYTDWYLPSAGELHLVYTNLANKGIGNFGSGMYWSSTEVTQDSAIKVDFSTGISFHDMKPRNIYVRAIRAFGTSENTLARINTTGSGNVTLSYVDVFGNVTADGGTPIVEKGVCLSTSHDPDLSDMVSIGGSGTGTYTSSFGSLTPGTIYYARAYATNSKGTAYGNEISFTTYSLPAITTNSVSNVAVTTATAGGTIIDLGIPEISVSGICWSNSANPTTSDAHTSDGALSGSFTSNMAGLTPGTSYYVRAYATNSAGTVYGDDVSFTTYAANAITDFDNNYYNIVTIGDQIWTKENLKVAHYNEGTVIPVVSDGSTWAGLSTGAMSYYNNDASGYGNTYGALYNWFPVEGGNLCPTGWHVPSDGEWKTLEMFLGMSQAEADATSWRGSDQGDQMKEAGTSHWLSGNNGTNTSGFLALPSGYRNNLGDFGAVGDYGNFWTSTQHEVTTEAVSRALKHEMSGVMRGFDSKKVGLAIRCLKNSKASVITSALTSFTDTTASLGGTVLEDGGEQVTKRGICWSTSPNPTIWGDKILDGTGTGAFASTLGGLTPATLYYARAYAINAIDTAYGNEISFTTAVTAIGKWYQGGYVFYIDGTGQNGLVAADIDQSIEQGWGCEGIFAGANQVEVGSGVQNTVDILNADNGTTLTAYICDILDLNGYSDWFLPSKNELGLMYTNLAVEALGGFFPLDYWSSTELNADSAFRVDFSSGTALPWEKYHAVRVRAVRAFGSAIVTTPRINTDSVIAITSASAEIWGTIHNNGGSAILGRGFCGNTTGFPVFPGDSLSYEGSSGIESFGSSIGSLSMGTTYYVRAYVITTTDTVYGNEFLFTTLGIPTITTDSIDTITLTSAVAYATISSNGGSEVTMSGICYGLSENPDTSGLKTIDGTALETFSSSLEGLTLGTTYHVRAYAVNAVGIAYGADFQFTTMALPTLSTNTITIFSDTTGIGGGNILSDGGSPIIEHGLCWNTLDTVSIQGNHTSLGAGSGIFADTLWGLNPNTLYYVKAYATNAFGITYGNKITFTTAVTALGKYYEGGYVFYIDSSGQNGMIAAPIDQSNGIVWGDDIEVGNTLNDVGKGKQNTMNMLNSELGQATAASICDELDLNGFNDWFLPSKDEMILIYQNVAAKIGGFNTSSSYWSSTEAGSMWACVVSMSNGSENCGGDWKTSPTYPVRAARAFGQPIATSPRITTDSMINIKESSLTAYGNIPVDGGMPVTDKGFCWYTEHSPTLANDFVSAGTGTGAYTFPVTGLYPDTVFYFRAYAINAVDTSYGTEIMVRTPLTSLGATYEGGIVFYIDGTGDNGLVCAPADQGDFFWGPSEMDYPGAQNLGIGSGAQNTTDIINAGSPDTTAAYVCDTLTLNGYNDWFLPSKDEMTGMFNNLYLKSLGNFTNDQYYWTSTEISPSQAYSCNMNNEGGTTTDDKYYVQPVRAVRAFGQWAPVVSAGKDQFLVGVTSCNLNALPPSSGTGTWEIFSGSGFVTDSNDPTCFLEGTLETTNILVWTVTSSYGTKSDTVTIFFGALPTTANAGSDTLHSDTTAIVMNANTPVYGNGLWSIAPGSTSSGSFDNPAAPNATFTGVMGHSYLLVWTISTSSGTSSDTVKVSMGAHSIGDSYQGGIIFYVDASTQNGLICAPSDISSGAVWGTPGILVPGADNSAIGSGEQNTLDIENMISTPGTAADLCASLVLGVYTDWFLPSVSEVSKMMNNLRKNGIGNLSRTYWTSTELSAFQAKMYDSSSVAGVSKTLSYPVRPVHSFGIAGPDQIITGSGVTILAGEIATEGEGQWTILSGVSGNFNDYRSATAEFYGNTGETYKLLFTTNSLYGTAEDSVIIAFCDIPSTANAGPDQLNLATNGAIMNANTPDIGTGKWSIAAGSCTGGTFDFLDHTDAMFTGINGNSYSLVWTVSNDCGVSRDTVNVSFGAYCVGDFYQGGIIFYVDASTQNGLICSPADISTGAIWGSTGYLIPGANGTAVFTGAQNTIDIENAVNTPGTAADLCANLSLGGYTDWFFPSQNEMEKFRDNLAPTGKGNPYSANYWTSSQSDANNATLVMMDGSFFSHGKSTSQPVRAARKFGIAGADQFITSGTTTTLEGVVVSGGNGNWSVMSGAGGSFTDPSLPGSMFIGAQNTSYKLSFTVSSSYGVAIDSVTIHFYDVPVAVAGDDSLHLDHTTTTLNANAPAQGSTGTWTIIKGTGGSVSDINVANTTFTGANNNSYTLVWKLSNPCGSSTDTVKISFGTYILGDTLQGGIIYYVEPGGTSGLVCSPDNLDNIRACFNGDNFNEAYYSGFGLGSKNSINTHNALQNPTLAAANCLAYSNNGYDDWYLPSAWELDKIYDNKYIAGIPNIASEIYWSSSYNGSMFSVRNLGDGSLYSSQGGYFWYVRAVHTFGVPNISLSLLSTSAVSLISGTTAVCGGNITEDGNDPVTQRGICWSISQYPDTTGSKIILGSGIGSFSGTLTGLIDATTYYVRSYAVNSAGVAYGNQVQFTTAAKVSDASGNLYNSVGIGNQIWMAENLNTAKYSDGTYIPNESIDVTWNGLSSGARCYYNNDSSAYASTRGALYNWYAASDARNLCPSGWHVPSDDEFKTLEIYLGISPVDADLTGFRGTDQGSQLKSTTGWNSDGNGTNTSGFNGLPIGFREIGGSFTDYTYTINLWSNSEYNLSNAWFRQLYSGSAQVLRNNSDKKRGFSVRCLKD